MANKIPRVAVREQDAQVRATNFEEVCYGYNLEEAQLEASRCLNCKNPRCVVACPVNINIPAFIHHLVEGNLRAASDVILEDSSLPSICGRVCPQETQCEGSCILGIKGEAVAIGKLERFVGDWCLDNDAESVAKATANGGKLQAADTRKIARLEKSTDLALAAHSAAAFADYGRSLFVKEIDDENGILMMYGVGAYMEVYIERDENGYKTTWVKMGPDEQWQESYSVFQVDPFVGQDQLDYSYFSKAAFGFALKGDNAIRFYKEYTQGSIPEDSKLALYAEYYVQEGVLTGMRMEYSADVTQNSGDMTIRSITTGLNKMSCTNYGTTVVESPFAE